MKVYQCDEDIIQNLKHASCDATTIACFMDKLKSGRQKEGIQLLEKFRFGLLDNLHKEQKRIDCLDYLIFMIKKQNQE